ncbi:MAG: rod shape-determining protein RodA [Tannerella sp.]|jgi:rod shape determining protein RodA|nr:rod shape-determining protein RodA [Tannerella sp.]
MPNNKTSILKSVDWTTIVMYFILIAGGWISICGATYDIDNPSFFGTTGRSGMQLLWIGISLVIVFLIMMLDKNFFETFAYLIYFLAIFVLILTIFIAPDIKGSRSWLVITSSIHLQPAEFAKFATALALAKFINKYEFNLLTIRNFATALMIVFIPIICIIMQSETGTAIVFLAFAFVLYREGMSGYILFTSLCAVLFFIVELKYESAIWNETPVGEFIVACLILSVMLFFVRYIFKERKPAVVFMCIIIVAGIATYIASFFYVFNIVWVAVGLIVCFSIYLVLISVKKIIWKYSILSLFAIISIGYLFSVDYVFNEVLAPHQQQRIKVSLGIEDDPEGVGYNVKQSKIAIGSGGFMGKGFLNGTQTKLKYVPEQDTDFIFCIIGEEFGFLGSFLALLAYGIFLLRLIILAERQDSVFGRVYGYSVVSIFLFHVVVNIGMVCGITPVIGIPLPFFSYGGSSLLGFTMLLFIFVRIDSGRKENI